MSLITLLKLARHETRFAWFRFRLHTLRFFSGLGDSGWLLHGLVRSQKPDVAVEIGSAHGYSTCLLALALEQNMRGHLWAIDPHEENHWSDDNARDTFDAINRNLEAMGEASRRVTIIRHRTKGAEHLLPAEIDLAFIDGDHGYESVKHDWECLRTRMRAFGIIVFHDTLWDRNHKDPYYAKWRRNNMGVPKLLEELRLQGYPVVTIDQDWGITLVQATVHGESFCGK